MNRILPLVILLALFSSCTVYKEYQIEVFQPGKITIPQNSKSAAIVYRNFKYTNDTLIHYYKDDYRLKKAVNDPENLDSVLVSQAMQKLAGNLKNHQTFETIHIFPELFKTHRGDKLPPLNYDLIENITDKSNSDLMISLETYSCFYNEYSYTAEMPTKSNEVITAAVWAVYDPVEKRMLDRKTMIDTVFWNGYDDQGNYQRKTLLPPRITALKIASQMAGENYAKRFFASWQTANRMYSVPPLPDFASAETYLQKGEWDNAILLWKRYVGDDNGKIAIQARYNMALAYEMKDDMDTASSWLTAAMQLATKYRSKEDIKRILFYQNALQKRMRDISKLNHE
ncbi:DUF6340 family protein [Maribellus sp. YY47]|uniref:DUF6340 family protein n=1 Tax=Maribellus sp. YY47 TaxID=2929486 RepID=UPI0020009C3C|nr:DUF6340 family protein [Maribellus sp. YY47]MCK3685016.1 DUF6340 family protein [Maribellus sp. YY47]